MKIFLYRIYSTTLSSYHAYDFTLKADFTKAITAQVSDMAHRPLFYALLTGLYIVRACFTHIPCDFVHHKSCDYLFKIFKLYLF